jgi:L-2-hydroxyglutarate oxidase LhgO
MKAQSISLIIDSVCKELGIPYCSVNPHLVTLDEDVKKMAKIYLQLKQIMGILIEIEDRHDLKDLKESMNKIIQELDDADHLVIRLARQLGEQNERN